jgi:hypothetical protein
MTRIKKTAPAKKVTAKKVSKAKEQPVEVSAPEESLDSLQSFHELFPEINDEQRTILEFEGMEEPDGLIEIIPGLTVEEMKPAFALIDAPYRIWQLNSSGHRYYYRYDDQGNPEFFPSVTTVLSQTLPKSKYLIEWIVSKGMDEAERYKEERADYGTFMHAEYQKLIIYRKYDFDDLKKCLKKYMVQKSLPDDFIYHADELKKDILALAQFIIDYDVRPLAVEIALVHPFHKYAGMIDLPCDMLDRPGGKERINAIVDFKSGRKGFYEEAEIQLHMYKEMWNVNFPQLEITRVFNFSPKDWRKRPSYNFKDQTDSANAKKIPGLLHIAGVEDGKKDNVFTSISGTINLDEGRKLTENVVSLTLAEIVKSKPIKEEKPKTNKIIVNNEVKGETFKYDNQADKTPEPVVEPKGKTKIIKRKSVEVAPEVEEIKTPTKRPNTRAKKESPAKALKMDNPEKEKGIDLLRDDLEM